MNEKKYNDQIAYYKAKLMMIIALALILVGVEVVVVWRWYNKNGKQMTTRIGFELKKQEFVQLWERLTARTVEVELEEEIRYGEGIGKLEPFE